MQAPDMQLACGHDYEEIWGEPAPPEIASLAFVTGTDLQDDCPEVGTELKHAWRESFLEA